MLLNTFSELFTGMQIHSAKFTQWMDNAKAGGAGQGQAGGQGGQNGGEGKGKNQDNSETASGKNLSLAEISRKKKCKVDRLKLTMKYSPMVERYLMTHKYETMNNVRGWKMLLTQDTEY
jgi:hypothetical protein